MRRCARLAPTFEGFDDDHVSAATWARRADIGWFVGRVVNGRRRDAKQLTGAFEMSLAGGAGEQAVMADAVEPAWQDMEQEAADKLIWGWSRDNWSVWLHFALLLQFCRSSMGSAS